MLFDKNTPAPVIERNVPIPPPRRGGTASAVYPFKALQPGDSVLYPCTASPDRVKARRAAYRIAEHHEWQITVRSLPEGIRVWRHA